MYRDQIYLLVLLTLTMALPGCGEPDDSDSRSEIDVREFYYPNGELKLREEYQEDIITKSTWFRPTGEAAYSTAWQDGSGLAYFLTDSGALDAVMQVEHYVPHGAKLTIDPEGRVESVEWYRDGDRVQTGTSDPLVIADHATTSDPVSRKLQERISGIWCDKYGVVLVVMPLKDRRLGVLFADTTEGSIKVSRVGLSDNHIEMQLEMRPSGPYFPDELVESVHAIGRLETTEENPNRLRYLLIFPDGGERVTQILMRCR